MSFGITLSGPRPARDVARGAARAGVIAGVAIVLLAVAGPVTGRWRTTVVASGSMEPTLEVGDLAVVVPITAADVRPGDVIVFRSPARGHNPTIHRVRQVRETEDGPVVQTQGDANDRRDPWNALLRGDTAYRLDRALPHLGRVLAVVNEPLMRLLSMILAPGALCVFALRAIWTEPRVVYRLGTVL